MRVQSRLSWKKLNDGLGRQRFCFARQNGTVRQQVIETLMREIMEYDAVFRREDASGAVTSFARH
jgi:hypothetical protein